MTETPTGYYTDADAIRTALGKHGPLSRADLVKASDVPRDVLAKALYQLKKKGDVIEEGELVMLAKAAKPAQDAPKEVEASTPTTPTPECSTEEIKPVPEPRMTSALNDMRSVADKHFPGGATPEEIMAAYDLARNGIAAILEENQKMRAELGHRNAEFAGLIADRNAYNTLKAKLRGLLDD